MEPHLQLKRFPPQVVLEPKAARPVGYVGVNKQFVLLMLLITDKLLMTLLTMQQETSRVSA